VSGRVVPHAPIEDGAVAAEPPLPEVGRLLAENRRRLERAPPLAGQSWTDLQREARRSAVEAAREFFRRRGEPVPEGFGEGLILAGHQPELFHPGVWVKNFALHGLARRHGRTPINLVVDNDSVKTTALRVPTPAAVRSENPHAVLIPFDHGSGEAPWEERPIADRALFDGFGEATAAVVRQWGFEPLLTDFWPLVRQEAERTLLLGECFAAARRELERRWGCHNLELPVSVLCGTAPFAWFAAHLLAELPRFHAVYNDAVREYRRRHGIRSRNHPVPDLAAEGDWLEAPFWGWRAGPLTLPSLPADGGEGRVRRGRLFARTRPDWIELRIGEEMWPALPAPVVAWSPDHATTAAWAERERQGLKVRSRALTNTLYARLFLGDLFIHGIGGGKYDELTDELIQRFYGREPPAFLILSATRLLPLQAPPVGPDDRRRLAHERRDLHWNPQRHLPPGNGEIKEWTARKQALIAATPQDAAGRRERFLALRAATAELRAPLMKEEQRLRTELTEVDRRLATAAVMRRRDYAFCLYPEALLRPFCKQFL